MIRKMLTAVLAVLLGVVLAAVPAAALTKSRVTSLTYDDMTKILTGGGGQYFSGGVVAGQWAWGPKSAAESHIYWGDPWLPDAPPEYHERFLIDAGQVWLDGWWDNGTYYKITATTNWQAEGADCSGAKTYFPVGGPEVYARWNVPMTAYCVFSEGILTEQSSGNTLSFRHEEIWSPPALCPVNPYIATGSRLCAKQTERWSDNNGHAFGPTLLRDVWLAQGLGMAWQVRNYAPTANPAAPGPVTWRADGRYYW